MNARGITFALIACGALAAGTVAEGAEGNLRYTITVSKFKNEANWRGRWDLGTGFETLMTDRLNATDQFIVLGTGEMRQAAMAEQDFAQSGRTAGGKKAPKTGRMTPAQLLVRGSITNVQTTAGGKGGIGFKGIRVGGSGKKAEINMTIYLVDSETGQVAASQSVTGKSQKRGLNLGYYGPALGGVTGNLGGFLDDNVGKACADAVDQAVQFLIAQLDDVAWEGTVVLANKERIIINRGSREGVAPGMKFVAGAVEEIVDPDTGERLGAEMTRIATLEVTEAKEKMSYCKPLEGGDKLTRGMTIFPE
jgi:curli biogenesis system outer membrane secretion channel CsgG